MKIRMTIPYRNRFGIILGCCFVLAFMGPLAVTLVVRAKQYGSAVICIALALILLAGAWKRLNYGIRIREKQIVLRSHRKKITVPYDAVREVVVTFTQENVAACVKTQDEEIRFVWEEMTAESKDIFPGRGWGSGSVPVRVGIRMTDRFVKNSIEHLSRCEKVRIENLYSLDL